MVLVCAIGWVLVIGMAWMLTGCASPAPAIIYRTPDIVEIDVPRAVLTPFDCQCRCEPHKALKIEIEDNPTYFQGLDP